ncbi:unnamed protein product [Peniophora sp. CBMAI 1063]|nr:unnamed protein product [Peniophora sp. CBMAI 1063]
MRALFNKFTGLSRGEKKEAAPIVREKPALGKLPEWPPVAPVPARTSSSGSSTKPLPDISSRLDTPEQITPQRSQESGSYARGPLSDVLEEGSDATPSVQPAQDSAGRSSRRREKDSEQPKKTVAFISPPPTPVGLQAVRDLPDDDDRAPQQISKSSSSRPSKDPRGSMSTAASGSRTDVGSSRTTAKPASTRGGPSPHPGRNYTDVASIQQSLRSGTPYSQRSTSTNITVNPPASWSEGAEGDLVSNLGARERTRQEVLWEIVASEERYVAELVKMRETFIVPLLHPYATSPIASPTLVDYDEYPRYDSPIESLEHLPIASRFLSPVSFRSDTPNTIASRRDGKDTPNIDTESTISDDDDDQMARAYSGDSRRHPPSSAMAKHNHPRSPYGASRKGQNPTVPFPSRSHHSLPPPARQNPGASTTSLGRQSYIGPSGDSTTAANTRTNGGKATPTPSSRGLLRKSKRSLNGTTNTTGSGIIPNGGVAPHQLPDDLRLCLEAVESRILEGHLKLSDGLRKRYEEQYPLVRSLADVFVANSHILRGYADYVLHLERALDQVQEALTAVSNSKPSKPSSKSKKPDADEWAKVCAVLRRLEQDANDKGETGLAISLSKPFQRLLKYPLLFQNLLFHTDPSTFEYESTLQMVAEVETIVRSIEDDKIQKEERDKTRDVLARIDGLDRVRQLAAPKPSRVLLEEKLLEPAGDKGSGSKGTSTPPPAASAGASGAGAGAPGKAVKGKSSLKRFSDALAPGGAKKDLWLVVFNDVTLRCQRTGTTSLPLGSAHSGSSSRANSMPELQGGKSKFASAGRRASHARPRNLYKFVKVESWSIGGVAQPREGVVSMDEVRSRQQAHLSVQPRIVPMPEENEDEDGGMDSDDSDRKSKMSFSYWGADKVTLQKPLVKPGAVRGAAVHSRTAKPGVASATGYSRESSANAKFGTRLVSGEQPIGAAARPSSRSTVTRTPVPRAGRSDDGHQSVKVTTTRPEWNGSSTTRRAGTSTPTAGPAAVKRPRNTSGPSASAVATKTKVTTERTVDKVLSSPAPSEDSGIGLYKRYQQQETA